MTPNPQEEQAAQARRRASLFVPRYSRAGKGAPIVKVGVPTGRNDPCPCGSGVKVKRCCRRPQ